MCPLLLVLTALTATVTILFSLIGLGRTVGYYCPMLWARAFCLLSWVRVTVSGRDNIDKRTSYVFVANHQGSYDIFAVYGFLGHQFRWMMKKALENIPLVGYSCRVSGHIYVDKSSPAAIRRTMQEARQRLQGGISVVVFPEGSRERAGRLTPFKRGAYMLATELGLPVVPITIDGAYAVMPRDAKLPRPGHIRLTIHKPIFADENGNHDLPALMEQSREAIASALPSANR